MNIITSRCIIRYFEEKDLDAFMKYRNDKGWMQYQGFKGLSKDEYRKALLSDISIKIGMQLAIEDKINHQLLGDIYLKQENDVLWLGYTISPQYSRNGYAGESVQAMINWAKMNEIKQIKAGVIEDNVASRKLLEKNGFCYVGIDEDELIYILWL